MATQLPYKMPGTEQGKIEFLCELIGISYSKFSAYPRSVVIEALTGIALYHQLDRHEKMKVMQFLHDNLRGPTLAAAIGKITDPMVNPHWGLWSKSTDQLKDDLEFKETVSTYLGLAGIGFSLPEARKLLGAAKTTNVKSGSAKGHPVLVVLIWGFWFNHEAGKKAVQEELLKRTMSH